MPRVIANSRNRRPTTSAMNSSGMSTAMSEMVKDRIVKPICSSLERGLKWGVAPLDVPGDILDHNDGIVYHEARGDRQRHQRQVVQTEPRERQSAEGTDQGQRHGDAWYDRRRQVAQEEKDYHHDQRHCQYQLKLDVFDRSTNGHCAIGDHGHLH
jgi:hypothetical protein